MPSNADDWLILFADRLQLCAGCLTPVFVSRINQECACPGPYEHGSPQLAGPIFVVRVWAQAEGAGGYRFEVELPEGRDYTGQTTSVRHYGSIEELRAEYLADLEPDPDERS